MSASLSSGSGGVGAGAGGRGGMCSIEGSGVLFDDVCCVIVCALNDAPPVVGHLLWVLDLW